MKPELELAEIVADREVSDARVVGIDWDDSESAAPVSIRMREPVPNQERKVRRIRKLLLRHLIVPTLTDIVMFVCLLALFSFYCLNSIGHALGVRSSRLTGWKKVGRLSRQFQLGLLFATALAFAGCVGYVGPDGGAAYVAGPDIYVGPEVHVFGGGFHGHDRAFGHRGAVSRGFHGGGGSHGRR